MDESSEPTRHNERPLTELDYREQAEFRCALRNFVRFSEEQSRRAGITPQQYVLLLLIRGHPTYPGVTVGDVADSMKLLPSTTSVLVDRAVQRGLLRRGEDPDDRRKVVLTLTEDGQRILDRIIRANRGQMGELEEVLLRDALNRVFRVRAGDVR